MLTRFFEHLDYLFQFDRPVVFGQRVKRIDSSRIVASVCDAGWQSVLPALVQEILHFFETIFMFWIFCEVPGLNRILLAMVEFDE